MYPPLEPYYKCVCTHACVHESVCLCISECVCAHGLCTCASLCVCVCARAREGPRSTSVSLLRCPRLFCFCLLETGFLSSLEFADSRMLGSEPGDLPISVSQAWGPQVPAAVPRYFYAGAEALHTHVPSTLPMVPSKARRISSLSQTLGVNPSAPKCTKCSLPLTNPLSV